MSVNKGNKTDYDFSEVVPKENKILNKYEYDLFHDEDHKVYKIVRLKRISTASKEEWRFFEDDSVTLTLDGKLFSENEKNFMRTVDGVNFLLKEYKSGKILEVDLKTSIKEHVKLRK